MKKCLQCDQVYGDETNFCLSDGTTLVSATNITSPNTEIPTIISNTPFVPPNYSIPNQPKSSPPILTYFLVGLLALIIGGGIIGAAVYFLVRPTETNIANTNTNANSNTNSNKDALADEKERLKAQQDKLEEDKKKLETDRKNLEAKKKQTPVPTVAPTSQNPDSRTAYITDPPTNIRETPNGKIICVIKQRNTAVNISGSTGVSDNNGTWYYTDICGRQGVIHSTQIRF